jgi:uncharacterized protein
MTSHRMPRPRSARSALALLLALVLLAAVPATALPTVGDLPARAAADVDDGTRLSDPDAIWTQHYLPAGEGFDSLTQLHADVLRPVDADGEAQPVILTVSPYTNRSGATTDYAPFASTPSNRFFDFLRESDALGQGYTYVMVDLPGFGGSGGCNDWGGVREQGAVVAAVEWAASQPWSNGNVALIGKSYDAWTGLMGVANAPEGLAAVIAMAPVYAGYRYLYSDGVRFLNSVATPALFTAIDAKPGPADGDVTYAANGAPQAWCYGVNIGLQQQDDPQADYWVERDLLPTSAGSDIPVFLTQGFIETNTKPDAAFSYWNSLDLGEGSRAWFGQFDHDRGNDRCANGRFCTGRSDFITEAMAFLDTHLKGVDAEDSGLADIPTVAVQDNLGRYRAEAQWPPADVVELTTALRSGTYSDDNGNRGSGGTSAGLVSVSEPLAHDVWLSGEPTISLTATTQVQRANLVGNVYDVAPDGRGVLVSRGALLLRGTGAQEVTLPMYGQDWLVREGHRLAVVVSGANSEWWTHVPTRTSVAVADAAVTLPFLTEQRTEFLEGQASPRLESWLANRRTTIPASALSAPTPFTLPGPLGD